MGWKRDKIIQEPKRIEVQHMTISYNTNWFLQQQQNIKNQPKKKPTHKIPFPATLENN